MLYSDVGRRAAHYLRPLHTWRAPGPGENGMFVDVYIVCVVHSLNHLGLGDMYHGRGNTARMLSNDIYTIHVPFLMNPPCFRLGWERRRCLRPKMLCATRHSHVHLRKGVARS